MRPLRRAARLREPALRGAELLVASGFALAQPLLDLLSRNAEFFAVRGSTPGDIVLFALVVTFAPALALLAVELAVGAIDARAGLALHLVFLGVLAAAFAIQGFERLGLDGTVALIAAAVAAGAAAALAAWRLRPFRTFLAVLTPAPLVFLALFLFGSDVRKLVLPADVDVAVANVRGDTPVVVVVLDELPVISLMDGEGRIDEGRYPNFARLARESTWFRNATTLSASTTLAVPALLTGNEPERGRLPVFQAHPDNLFTLLGGRYRMNVTESQTRLCPPQLCERDAPAAGERLSSLYSDARVVYLHLVAPPKLEERLPTIDEAWMGFGDAHVDVEAQVSLPDVDPRTFYLGRVDELKRFVGAIADDGGRPTLSFLHVLLPHGPWLYFPSGRVSAVANPTAPGRTGELWRDEDLALQAHQRHLLQLGFTDRLLGELIARLERTGVYERALVVVTSDHGISFRGGDRRRAPTPTNLAELAFVPLFVKLPGERRGRVVDRHVRIVDVVPTIADALDVELPWRVDGRSALASNGEPGDVRVGRVRAPYADALAAREQALRRQLALFGSGDWGDDLFAVGPYERLVGLPVDALGVAGEADGEAVVDGAGSRLLRSLPARSAGIPSPLVGTLTGVRAGRALALAVNGRVAAVARAFELAGAVRFSALAPESAFRQGANEVRVFVLDGPAAAADARELRTSLSP